MHVITYVWTGGFDRKYHDEASAEKFKGEFVGPMPPAWIRDVKDYVRSCYNNPDWIEEIASDVTVQMTEGGSDGIFFDVLVPPNAAHHWPRLRGPAHGAGPLRCESAPGHRPG